MSDRVRLALILGASLLLASVGTHLVASALDIRTRSGTGHKQFGDTRQPARGLVLGSSLTYSALDWTRVAQDLGATLESWPVPGSSPAEWEQMQPRSPEAVTTFVGVSIYDLNEVSVCDFRADLVPLSQTASDLWISGSDVAFARRMFAWYAMTWSRKAFPTAGRSDHVIFGLRDQARVALQSVGSRTMPAEQELNVASDFVPAEKLSDWPQDRLVRRLAVMRASQGSPWFSGPKHLALLRLLRQARRQGRVMVFVLPVSPRYRSELLSPDDTRRFEASLAAAIEAVPEATWVRLDHDPRLDSDDCYFDLVHVNLHGRNLVTPALLAAVEGVGGRP